MLIGHWKNGTHLLPNNSKTKISTKHRTFCIWGYSWGKSVSLAVSPVFLGSNVSSHGRGRVPVVQLLALPLYHCHGGTGHNSSKGSSSAFRTDTKKLTSVKHIAVHVYWVQEICSTALPASTHWVFPLAEQVFIGSEQASNNSTYINNLAEVFVCVYIYIPWFYLQVSTGKETGRLNLHVSLRIREVALHIDEGYNFFRLGRCLQ